MALNLIYRLRDVPYNGWWRVFKCGHVNYRYAYRPPLNNVAMRPEPGLCDACERVRVLHESLTTRNESR